jgi:hypothetical protein
MIRFSINKSKILQTYWKLRIMICVVQRDGRHIACNGLWLAQRYKVAASLATQHNKYWQSSDPTHTQEHRRTTINTLLHIWEVRFRISVRGPDIEENAGMVL